MSLLAKSLSPLRNAFSWYSTRLETHPLATKGVTSGIITGSGDLLCQSIVHFQSKGDKTGNDNYFSIDWLRTARFTFLGTVLVAPIVHHWYGALMKYIPGRSIKSTIKRTFYDQTIMAPLFIPAFMTSLLLLEGKDFTEDIVPALKSEYYDLITTNWAMWIPAQIINFRFVPGRFQVLFSNITALVWNTYFSYKASGDANH